MKDFNIQVASNLTGVSVHTLRTWEKRYQVVTPARTDSGRRLYNEEDVRKLKALNDLCSLGHNISSIANKSMEELDELLETYGLNEIHSPNINLTSNPEQAKKSLNHLLLALEKYRLDVVSHELYNLKMVLSPKDLALKVIAPLLVAVGQKVNEGTLSIAQEHALSSVIKFHLGQFIYRSYEEKNRSKDLFVLATPEKDYHEFGILLAALLCLNYNKNFFYLGANMPAEALVEASLSIGATEIVLGTTYIEGNTDSDFLTNYISTCLNNIKKNADLVVGGSGYFETAKFQKASNFLYLPTLNHLDLHLKGKS